MWDSKIDRIMITLIVAFIDLAIFSPLYFIIKGFDIFWAAISFSSSIVCLFILIIVYVLLRVKQRDQQGKFVRKDK